MMTTTKVRSLRWYFLVALGSRFMVGEHGGERTDCSLLPRTDSLNPHGAWCAQPMGMQCWRSPQPNQNSSLCILTNCQSTGNKSLFKTCPPFVGHHSSWQGYDGNTDGRSQLQFAPGQQNSHPEELRREQLWLHSHWQTTENPFQGS